MYIGRKDWGILIQVQFYGHELNSLFVETVNDYGFEQLLNVPTRGNHILNLVLSIHPDMISQVDIVPEISDQEAITFQLDQLSNRSLERKLQKVYQYHKAINISKITEKMKIFTTSFLANNLYSQSVEDKWVLFRDTVLNIVGKSTLEKQTS